MIPAGLPCVTGVISKFLLLNPNRCFGKQIDASQVVPVGVADDDVRDFCGLNTGELHGFVGAKVFCRWKVFEEGIAVIAAVKEDIVAAAANEPHDHGDDDFLALRRAHNRSEEHTSELQSHSDLV